MCVLLSHVVTMLTKPLANSEHGTNNQPKRILWPSNAGTKGSLHQTRQPQSHCQYLICRDHRQGRRVSKSLRQVSRPGRAIRCRTGPLGVCRPSPVKGLGFGTRQEPAGAVQVSSHPSLVISHATSDSTFWLTSAFVLTSFQQAMAESWEPRASTSAGAVVFDDVKEQVSVEEGESLMRMVRGLGSLELQL